MAQGQGRDEQRVFSAWVASPEDTAKHHGVDVSTGLTASQVAEKRAEHGFNELEKEPGKSLFALVLEQFDDMLVKASLSSAHTAMHLLLRSQLAQTKL
jgi:P-type Ca2+ transporter type 2C